MGTHIVIMNEGKIMQQGSPREIYENPDNLFVAQFIGSPPANIIPFGEYSIGIRPENITLTDMPEAYIPGKSFSIPAKIHSAEQLGGETIYHLTTAAGKLDVKTAANWDYAGKGLFAQIELSKLMVFDRDGSRVRHSDSAKDKFRDAFIQSTGDKRCISA